MDPNTRGPESTATTATSGRRRQRPPRESLTPDFSQHAPALARTVQLVSGALPADRQPRRRQRDQEACPPAERPARPVKLTTAERAEAERAARRPRPARPRAAQPAAAGPPGRRSRRATGPSLLDLDGRPRPSRRPAAAGVPAADLASRPPRTPPAARRRAPPRALPRARRRAARTRRSDRPHTQQGRVRASDPAPARRARAVCQTSRQLVVLDAPQRVVVEDLAADASGRSRGHGPGA
ncbi:hypothetical protein SVIOM74S_01223 [Streptomyces violarus]